MSTVSPFSQNRFEYEGKHSYFLPHALFANLQPAKPKLLIGSRGSGKTTLMRALCWDEQTSNESLMNQLPHKFFDGKYVGTYVKLPSTQLNLIDTWLHSHSDTEYASVFSYYLELICVQLIAHSLGEIAARELFPLSVELEQKTVDACIEALPYLRKSIKSDAFRSLPELTACISTLRKSIEHRALRKEDPVDLIVSDEIGQVGTTTSELLIQLGRLCDEATNSELGSWHFKVCMDEGESLNQRQQRVMRTLVRLAQWPVFHVISFVRLPEDRTTTEFPKLSLQAADIEPVIIDGMIKSDFKTFAEGVATIRCQEALQTTNVTIDLYRMLGSLDINRLLFDILSISESVYSKELLVKARKLSDTAAHHKPSPGTIKEGNQVEMNNQDGSLPIWQSYLIDKLDLEYPFDATRDEQRRYESVNLRKKMVASYLSLCRELQTAPRYASADMVLEISDNCIRDFLSQMHHLYEASGKNLQEFLNSELSVDVQYRALAAASQTKKASLPASGVQSPVQARRIIEGLSLVTATLQASLPGGKHLEVPEQGKFALALTEKQAVKHRELLDLIYDSAEAGFLRTITEDDSEPRFRVHTSLAPAFGFSYRGAYYDTWLIIDELERIRMEATDDGVRRAASSIVTRLVGEEPRPLLKDLE